MAIVKPVHRGSLDETDELVGFFKSPEIEVDGGASGAVGKGRLSTSRITEAAVSVVAEMVEFAE